MDGVDASRRAGGSRIAVAIAGAFLAGVIANAAVTDGRPAATPVAAGADVAVGNETGAADLAAAPSPGSAGVADAGVAPGPAAAAAATSASPAGGSTVAAPAAATAARPAAASPAAASTGTRDAPAGGNGGATFRGVTDKSIRVSFANLDSATLGTACPRCGNGDAGRVSADALLTAWRRDGLLPVYGRDIEVKVHQFDVLSAEQRRNACLQSAGDKPFIVMGVLLAEINTCLAQEFKVASLSGLNSGDDEVLAAGAPYIFQNMPTRDRVWRNYVRWLHDTGQLKGQKLGLYSPADSSSSNAQRSIDRSFRKPLTELGYKLEADVKFDGPNSAPLAAQQFQRAGVTVALIIPTLTEPSGFQTAAERLAYRPKYPIAEIGSEMNDAVADVTFQADAQAGNLGMKTQYWDWAARKPATLKPDNPKGAYCLKAYQDFAKRELDVFDDNSVISSLMHICSTLEIFREAIVKAGPKLTLETFVQGMYELRDFATTDIPAVSFGPGKHAGGDVFSIHQFKKERWQPSNNYWGLLQPYRRFPVR